MSDQTTITYQQPDVPSGAIISTPTGRLLSLLETRYIDLQVEGHLSRQQMRQALQISSSELRRIESDPDVQNLIDSTLEAYRLQILRSGVARRELRIQAKNERWQLLNRIRQQRTSITDPESPFYIPSSSSIPGADTGLLTRSLKTIGSGMNQEIVEEWKLDKDLLTLLSDIEDEVAKETGQSFERHIHEVSGKAYIGIDIDMV